MSAIPDSEPTDTAELAEDDFRVRVAREKRERMRERLLEAAVDACLASASGTRPVIDDVIKAADVSRGTFYKYFDSVDELLDELGKRMVDDTLQAFEHMFDQLHDLGARAAAGPLLSLLRAAMQPRRVAIAGRIDMIDYLARSEVHGGSIVMTCLEEARNSGALAFDSLPLALDFTIGATREGARRIAHEGCFDAAYIRGLTTMILTGLGMKKAAAQRAVDGAWAHFLSRSAEVAWWKPVGGL